AEAIAALEKAHETLSNGLTTKTALALVEQLTSSPAARQALRDARVARAEALRRSGAGRELAAAEAELVRARSAFETDPSLALTHAEVLLALDRPADAERALEAPIVHDPGNALLRRLRAEARVTRGDTEGARADLDALLERSPDDQRAR